MTTCIYFLIVEFLASTGMFLISVVKYNGQWFIGL